MKQSAQHYLKLADKFRHNKLTFVQKAKKIHGDKYIYDEANYINNKTKIKIICPAHGEFEQRPDNHIGLKQGCPMCKREGQSERQNYNSEIFINKSKEIFGDKFSYEGVKYIDIKTPVTISCLEHGDFCQAPQDHLQGKNGCKKCTCSGVSRSETEIYEFINSLVYAERHKKISDSNLELDIFIPQFNMGIEYNGLYWHSSAQKPNNYHLDKLLLCEKLGIKLVQIFEDEWIFKKRIVKSRIKSLMGIFDERVFARKTVVKSVSKKEAAKFLNENHLQGSIGAKINLGLYLEKELYSLMSFSKYRKALGSLNKEDCYELIRFCNKNNTTVLGGASKLLNFFAKTFHPKQIISYADRRWSNGDLYNKMGFQFMYNTKPNYYYIINKYRKNRFNFRKSELVKQGFDIEKTELEIMDQRKIFRIYDCGSKKFIFNFY